MKHKATPKEATYLKIIDEEVAHLKIAKADILRELYSQCTTSPNIRTKLALEIRELAADAAIEKVEGYKHYVMRDIKGA